MSKHICWRGFKRMCDRCSRSLFHAPHLNNSPCADNPCTPDHLHGTTELGNFRLRPSVCFCSITATGAQGALLTQLYSAGEESPFHCTSIPWFPFSPVFVTHGASSSASTAAVSVLTSQIWVALEHISDRAVARAEEAAASCPTGDSEQAALHPGSMSRNHSVLSWSLNCVGALTERHHLCWQLWHQAWNTGICWCPSLPPLCLPPPPPPPPMCIPIRKPSTACWGADREVKWLCSSSSMSSPGVFTIMVEDKK